MAEVPHLSTGNGVGAGLVALEGAHRGVVDVHVADHGATIPRPAHRSDRKPDPSHWTRSNLEYDSDAYPAPGRHP